MITKEPRIRFGDIFGAFFVAVGLLIVVVIIHILAINSEGNTQEVLETTFIVALRVYITLVIFGMAGIIIHLLRYMVWQVTTPKWIKKKIRSNRNG
jgi:hypothetical protein